MPESIVIYHSILVIELAMAIQIVHSFNNEVAVLRLLLPFSTHRFEFISMRFTFFFIETTKIISYSSEYMNQFLNISHE